jgi:hypothetical protein
MLTRRSTCGLITFLLLRVYQPAPSRAQSDEMITVRIRADESARNSLPPIALQNLSVEPDQSPEARDIASRAPPGRFAPVILIIVGALALTQIVQLINELVRQFYYGGVIIDGRKSPPEISNDPKIPANMIFVFGHDGTFKKYQSGQLTIGLLRSVLIGAK